MTAASNVLGTRPDVAAIAAVAHAAGALCYVDGVHATPHVPVDVSALGADFYTTSAYKWAGPHVAAVVADPALLETLWPDKLALSSDEVPARFERGTLPFADLAGWPRRSSTWRRWRPVRMPASGDDAGRCRRRGRVAARADPGVDDGVEEYEMALFAELLDGLGAMSRVTLYGKAARRAPTAFFTVTGLTPREVAARLAARGVNTWNGDNYAYELCSALGLEPDGAVPGRPGALQRRLRRRPAAGGCRRANAIQLRAAKLSG